MNKKEIEKRVYILYLNRIGNILQKKLHYLKRVAKEENINKKEEMLKKILDCNTEINSCFYLYEDILGRVFTPDAYEKIDSTTADKFKCSLDTEDYCFNCFGSFYYKNVEYPAFIDDYGMSDFIEFDGTTLDLNLDWWYIIDCKNELDKFLDSDTEDNCSKAIDYIISLEDQISFDESQEKNNE